MVKKVLIGSLSIIVLICVAGALFVYLQINKDIDEKFAGTCTRLDLPGSGEDIQIDRGRGLAYLSVLDRAATVRGDQADPGQIMRVDLNIDTPDAVNALIGAPDEFYPHGISIFIDDAGQRHLIVINHPKNRGVDPEHIERFVEKQPGVYEHAETFSNPLITRPNDLVAVGPRQFYVAQDTGQGTGITDTLLVYFDGNEYRVVTDDIKSGGGINVSPDGSTIYVAETNAQRVRAIELDADGMIASERFLELPSSPDNIDVAEDGSLWIGGHSNILALVMHMITGSDAPTQILRVEPDGLVEEIYLNKGDEISTGSGGATWQNKLLIGSITATHILICERDGA